MVLNVKFETLTYSVSPFGGEASAPLILGRSEGSSAESDYAVTPLADKPQSASLAAQIWLMLSFQILAYFSFVTKHLPKPRFVMQYGDDDGPLRTVRLNRSLKRKLARMQRRGLVGSPRLRAEESQEESQIDDSLSPTQFLEHMVRTRNWSRVRVYRLGLTRKDLRRIAVMWASLQGCRRTLTESQMCRAPLCPD